nr:hypothetical protein [Tanacetum cinerariifolium]
MKILENKLKSLKLQENQPMESSATWEYPSLIHTFFVTHTINGVFMRDEDRAIYEQMLRLQALGSKTPSGYCQDRPQMSLFLPLRPYLNARTTPAIGSDGCGDDEMADDEDGGEDEEDEEDSDNNARFVTRKPRLVDYIVFLMILDDLALLDQMR